jgi:3-methylcrotonyl-CoA carboxylase alpha subunit
MHYDPMIAKVIVWDRDRAGCLRHMRKALKETQVVGVSTNLDLLMSVTAHRAFQAGGVDTGFIERHRDELLMPPGESGPAILALAALYLLRRREAQAAEQARRSPDPGSPWHDTHAWRLNSVAEEEIPFLWQGRERQVNVRHGRGALTLQADGTTLAVDGLLDGADLVADVDGRRARATVVMRNATLTILVGGSSHTLELVDRLSAANPAEAVPGSLASPMPGRVVNVLVKEGEKVKAGAPLVVIEAMKMEHTVTAPLDGTVTALHYAAGDMIDEGVELLVIAQ